MRRPVNVELPGPRMDRRRLKTRTALVAAARALFAERPAQEVSITDITDAADLAKGSFYNHFPDKDSLAEELLVSIRQHVESLVTQSNEGVTDAYIAVAQAVCTVLNFAVEDPQAASALLRLTPNALRPEDPLYHGVASLIRLGHAQGQMMDIGTEEGVLIVAGTATMTLFRILERPDDVQLDVLAISICAALLRALGAPTKRSKTIATAAVAKLLRHRRAR
jgi:AcrR family transcriptional regulator